jgi:hypothetical protein
MTEAGEVLSSIRALARGRAAAVLLARGFVADALPPDDPSGSGSQQWIGPLELPDLALSVEVRVRLPDDFPDTLPDVLVDRAQLPRRMAHVDRSGKVCIAPGSNLLLDADRPEALLSDALARAAIELARGHVGSSDADLQTEFLAYWWPTETPPTYSICAPAGVVRQICLTRVTGVKGFLDPGMLVADQRSDADAWALALGGAVDSETQALFVPLMSNFAPPEFDAPLSVREVSATIEAHADPVTVLAYRKHIETTTLPATILLSLPEVSRFDGRRLVAIRMERPPKELRTRLAHGFRPGHVPSWRIIQLIGAAPATRLRLERVDHEFLTARGGTSGAFAEACVVVVGVGAIGSEVARNLAALGIGRIVLLDPDDMEAENVHRHVLGVRHLGTKKVASMATDLKQRFPHLDISYRSERAEKLVMTESRLFMEANAIVLATGEETLERRLNRLLVGGPPRIHTWVEPLGLGGHALACGLRDPLGVAAQAKGCFECLFQTDPTFGLLNLSALTAPGQEIRKSLAGCAGTFSPFSALDARRSALEATELAGALIATTLEEPCLVTWRGTRTAFEKGGFRLSRRAAVIGPTTRSEATGADFYRTDCSVCHAAGN